jgi:hypothetical protein
MAMAMADAAAGVTWDQAVWLTLPAIVALILRAGGIWLSRRIPMSDDFLPPRTPPITAERARDAPACEAHAARPVRKIDILLLPR